MTFRSIVKQGPTRSAVNETNQCVKRLWTVEGRRSTGCLRNYRAIVAYKEGPWNLFRAARAASIYVPS